MRSTINKCLTPNPDERADIVQVASHIAHILLNHMDVMDVSIQKQSKLLEAEQIRSGGPLRLSSQESRWSSSCGGASLSCEADISEENRTLMRNISVPEENGATDDELSATDSSSLPPRPPVHKQSGSNLRRKPRSAERIRDSNANCRSTDRDTADLEQPLRASSAGKKSRPVSAGSGLSISHKNLRAIADPVSSILFEVHKILYACQLNPPNSKACARRRLIERFRRLLSHRSSNVTLLKENLMKLEKGSKEFVDFGDSSAANLCIEALTEWAEKSGEMLDKNFVGITYEQFRTIIDSYVAENDYELNQKYARTLSQPYSTSR